VTGSDGGAPRLLEPWEPLTTLDQVKKLERVFTTIRPESGQDNLF
jgi:hypothetical protein